jgi:glyoxylase-like metal-dependent hydrolase (beta-lactamase superfamily II)
MKQEQLLYISDTVLYPFYLEHPDWVPKYDIVIDEADASKRRIFDQAAEEKCLVLGMHFPLSPVWVLLTRKRRDGSGSRLNWNNWLPSKPLGNLD